MRGARAHSIAAVICTRGAGTLGRAARSAACTRIQRKPMPNPWMSFWLSAANAWAGGAARVLDRADAPPADRHSQRDGSPDRRLLEKNLEGASHRPEAETSRLGSERHELCSALLPRVMIRHEVSVGWLERRGAQPAAREPTSKKRCFERTIWGSRGCRPPPGPQSSSQEVDHTSRSVPRKGARRPPRFSVRLSGGRVTVPGLLPEAWAYGDPSS
jgi:hypothetical protein